MVPHRPCCSHRSGDIDRSLKPGQPLFRGLPPPTPRPGREAFHASIVSGSQPRTVPVIASAGGKRYRLSVSGFTPIRSATSARFKYRTVICAPYEEPPPKRGSIGGWDQAPRQMSLHHAGAGPCQGTSTPPFVVLAGSGRGVRARWVGTGRAGGSWGCGTGPRGAGHCAWGCAARHWPAGTPCADLRVCPLPLPQGGIPPPARGRPDGNASARSDAIRIRPFFESQ